MIRVLELTSTLDPAINGGISSSLPDLSAALRQFQNVDSSVKEFGQGWRRGLSRLEDLASLIQQKDLVHIHGLWEPHCALTARVARGNDRPYMVSAHGSLERWAYSQKSWKKKPYTWLVERQTLNRAACLRALTRSEIEDYRRIGVSAPIALIPNGVSIPQDTSSDAFLESFPELQNKSLVLFLGRIHYKKGLDILCRAWAGKSRQGRQLVIAGPKDSRTFQQIRSLVRSLGIERSVTFTGMLHGGMKWSALAASDLFVLASRGEGFSMAALEAAGMGVPLLLSDCCNFPEVADLDCGWIVRPEIGPVAEALNDAWEKSPGKREAMGLRCQQMIQDRYTWKAIARQMSEVYQGLLAGTGPTGVEIFN